MSKTFHCGVRFVWLFYLTRFLHKKQRRHALRNEIVPLCVPPLCDMLSGDYISMELSRSSLPSFTSLVMSSPKSVFCHANQGRVKWSGSFTSNDS